MQHGVCGKMRVENSYIAEKIPYENPCSHSPKCPLQAMTVEMVFREDGQHKYQYHFEVWDTRTVLGILELNIWPLH